jgi:hypothetical protein
MSLSVVQPDRDIVPAFNRILYRMESDNSYLDGFKFAVKYYIEDVLQTTAYYDPAPDNSQIEIDVQKFISTSFSYDGGLFYTGDPRSYNNGILKNFYLKVYEYYDLLGNGVWAIDTSTEIQTTTKQGIAMSLPELELRNWYASLGEANSLYSKLIGYENVWLPLTDYKNIRIRKGESYYFGLINKQREGGITNNIFVVATYNDGSQAQISPQYYLEEEGIVYFKYNDLDYDTTNVKALELWCQYQSEDGPQQYIFANITYFNCSKYMPLRLAYLNKYGAFDLLNFDLVSRQSFDNIKKDYKRDFKGFIYEDNFFSPVVKNISPVYYTREQEKWRITSDYLTEQESKVARQLISSPLVYLVMPTEEIVGEGNVYVPVKINMSTYEIKKSVNDKLFNLELDVEFSFQNYRQSI